MRRKVFGIVIATIIISLNMYHFYLYSTDPKSSEGAKDFNQCDIDCIVNENVNIGYEFEINQQRYYQKDYNFYYKPKNQSDLLILTYDRMANDFGQIYWMDIKSPFRVEKKANDSILILTKDNKKYIFRKEMNPPQAGAGFFPKLRELFNQYINNF